MPSVKSINNVAVVLVDYKIMLYYMRVLFTATALRPFS